VGGGGGGAGGGPRARPAPPAGAAALGRPLNVALDDFERGLIGAALAQAQGNVAEAARVLHTDRANLYRRMRRLGLDRQ
jgi:transcriptional regulator with GAF, ATPase, and Fis domain